MSPINQLPPHFFKMHCNIILPSTKLSPAFNFPHKNHHPWPILGPALSISLPNVKTPIRWAVKIMKVFTLHFSAACCHFLLASNAWAPCSGTLSAYVPPLVRETISHPHKIASRILFPCVLTFVSTYVFPYSPKCGCWQGTCLVRSKFIDIRVW